MMIMVQQEHAGRERTRRRRPVAIAEATRLLVVDDHPAVRRGLRELLEDHPDFLVVASVPSAEEAMIVAEQSPVDVVVADYHLGGRNGLWLSRKLKRLAQPPAVVIYSAYSDGLLAAAAVVAEADGLVSKGGLGSELSDAIRAVVARRPVLPVVPSRLAGVIREQLDDEEQAIYGLRLAGISVADIAETLGISDAEVESHLSEMLSKLEPPGIEVTIPRRRGGRSIVDAR